MTASQTTDIATLRAVESKGLHEMCLEVSADVALDWERSSMILVHDFQAAACNRCQEANPAPCSHSQPDRGNDRNMRQDKSSVLTALKCAGHV